MIKTERPGADRGWFDYDKTTRGCQANNNRNTVGKRSVTDVSFTSKFLSLLKRAERIMVSTGAGVSTESGVPAFRGIGGLWEQFKPEELATPEAFARDPEKVWRWYDWRRQMISKVEPNNGHKALVEMESLFPYFFLFTQNIDGLHQRAGSKNVQEMHGNIWNAQCVKEKRKFPLLQTPLDSIPPKCECGSLIRPDVVWFGEALPAAILKDSWSIAANCDFFFLIGSSATVEPAASLAWIARENGGVVVEINEEATDVTEIANEVFLGKSGVILPALVEALRNHG
jgi:NAD-dependent deacetylase